VALALLAGATVQSLVGLGLGLVSAPVITLVEPRLMPELMLWLAFALPFVTLASEREDIDWHGLGWSLPSRVLGTAVGVVAVTLLEPRLLGVAVGVMVLVAVALTWRTVVVPLTRTSLVVAGAVSGVTGTATSIGGPPLALLYQHQPPRTIRTTLAVYFLVGELDVRSFLLAVTLAPVLAVGAVLGRVLRPRLPEARVRAVVLVVCASSALVLLVRSLA
jgi:uncharacterized membrane protein YfcA